MPDVDRVPVRVWFGGSYTPTEWTSRSAENPIVVNAPRILAERYHEENPGTEIVYEEGPGGEDYFAWLTAGATAGTAPNLVRSTHNFAVQNGWAVPIDDYLAQPNRYAPDYDKWNDIFYPTFMNSLIQPDGNIYCAPIDNIWPNIEVGLAYNKETFDSMGLEPPSTWSAQMEVSRALKEAGDGLAPWQHEQATGNLWPLVTISDMSKQVISVGLFRLSRTTNDLVDFGSGGPLFAGYVLASIPLVVLFIVLGKFYVEGLVESGIKM